MFKRTNQVQTVDVNEWVNKLMAAQDDVKTVERIRRKLDTACESYIKARESELEERKNLYSFYYDGMPIAGDFEKWLMELIGYQLPVELLARWQNACSMYNSIIAEQLAEKFAE
jgi:hypothetical protein